MMNNLYYGHMFGWGGGIMMLIFWIAVILLVMWTAKEFHRGDSGDPRSKTSLDILKERYAKGEVDKKEFEEKKKDLAD